MSPRFRERCGSPREPGALNFALFLNLATGNPTISLFGLLPLPVACHFISSVGFFLSNLIYIMAFGDLKTEKGVKALNDFLADRSYIEGYVVDF